MTRFNPLLTGILLLLLILTTETKAQDEIRYLENSGPPVQTGDSFPAFTLTDMQYRPVHSLDLVRESPVLLVYYRGGW